MPSPYPPPDAPRMQHVLPRPADQRKTEVPTLTASTAEEHEIQINYRKYKVLIPKGWIYYDNSYRPSDNLDQLPGKKEFGFCAPEKTGTAIVFADRGRGPGAKGGKQFEQLLKNHKDPAKSEDVTGDQIANMLSMLGTFVCDNQYLALRGVDGQLPFHIDSCRIVTVAPNLTGMLLVGRYQGRDGFFLRRLYLDGSRENNCEDIHQIYLETKTRAEMEKYTPLFAEVLKSINSSTTP